MPRITNWLEVEKRLSEQNVNIKNAENRIVKTDNSLKFMLQALLINLKDLYDSQSEISLWFYDIDKPTTSTLPYTSWDDPSEHYGDFFYSRTKGIIYKFNEQGEWEQLNDATLLNAMALTNSKLEAGDHERKVFLDDPTTPYDSGDWWVKEDGTLFICQIGRQDGTRMPNDFINSLDYAENLAIATGNMMEVLKGTVITVTDQAVTYLDKATNTTTTISGNSIKTGELISNNYVPRTSGTKISLNDGTIDTKNFKISANGTLSIVGYATDADIARIESEIGEVTDVTKTNETSTGYVEFTDINISEPIRIEIHPTSDDITALHPKVGLHPRVGLRPHSRQLYFENTTDGTTRNYNLPHDLLYLNSNIYDEFLLDFENTICRVTQRVGILNGTKYELPEPIITDYVYPKIGLTQGDYQITLKSNRTAYMKITLMTYNMYTTQYSTKYETKSAITQSSNEIRAEVAETYFTQEGAERLSSEISANATEIGLRLKTNDFTNAEITAKLNDGTSTVKLSADKINLQGYVTLSNLSTAGQTEINGANIKTGTLSASKITSGTLDATKVTVTNLSASNINTGSLTLSNFTGTYAINSAGFKVTKTGEIISTSGKIGGYKISNYNLYSTQVGISSENNHGWAFWAGDDLSGEQPSEYGKNAPFRVGHNGYVYASNIDIAGGSFNVNNNFLVSDNGYLTIKDQGYLPNREPNLLIRKNNDTRIRTEIYSNYLILTGNSNTNTDMIEMTGGYGLDIYCSTYQGQSTGYFFSANNTSGTYSSSEIYAVNGYCMHGRDGHTYSCGWDDDRERLNFYIDNILVKTL